MKRREDEKEETTGESALIVKCTGCETEHQLPYRLIDRFYNELFPIQPLEKKR